MDKQMGPFIHFAGDQVALEPRGIACMSYVWDHAGGRWGQGVVRTMGLRSDLHAPGWTHAVSEVTWMGSVAYLALPARSDDEIEARHDELVALLQSLPWPQGFDEAVRRWGVSPLSGDLAR